MRADVGGNRCITYIPVPHLGFGFVQTCVNILENFPSELILPTLFLPRAFAAIAQPVEVKEAISHFLPYRLVSAIARPLLSFRFKRALANADPSNTIAYFWPSPPSSLLHYARRRGILTIREMINTHVGSAKVILDDAYGRLGLPLKHNITDEMVQRERDTLLLYDYIFSSSPMVEKSLMEFGVSPDKILRSSYGWLPSRFSFGVVDESIREFRCLFVGTLCVRKGLPQLLAAWRKSRVSGELVLVGSIEDPLRPLLAQYSENDNIRLVGFTLDVADLYKSSDVFIFPTLEEGDPQVTYEAAAFGLPVITTPMGSGNVVKDGLNGLIVGPYDIDGLAAAILRLATDAELRKRLGQQAARDAQDFTYEKVGRQRAETLHGLLNARSRKTTRI